MEKKYYTVSWNRPRIYSEEPIRQESEGGFKSLEEAQKFAREIERGYEEAPKYAFQVFQSMKIIASDSARKEWKLSELCECGSFPFPHEKIADCFDDDSVSNRCGKPHNNADGEQSCIECQMIKKGI